MMRAALAELAERTTVEVWSVTWRAEHDRSCGCDDAGRCDPPLGWRPTRSELVSARRALHRLAEADSVTLERRQLGYMEDSRRILIGRKCCPASNPVT